MQLSHHFAKPHFCLCTALHILHNPAINVYSALLHQHQYGRASEFKISFFYPLMDPSLSVIVMNFTYKQRTDLHLDHIPELLSADL